MFDFLKPPDFHIVKRTPKSEYMDAMAISTYVDMLAERLEKKQKNLVKAIVLAVWALNANKEGKFSLSDIDALYIENSAKICSLSLSDSEMELSGTIILELIEKGLIISSP